MLSQFRTVHVVRDSPLMSEGANKTTTTHEQQLLQAEQLLQQLLQLKVIEQKSRSRTLFKVIELNSEGQRTED